jgi:hypothetical protein
MQQPALTAAHKQRLAQAIIRRPAHSGIEFGQRPVLNQSWYLRMVARSNMREASARQAIADARSAELNRKRAHA